MTDVRYTRVAIILHWVMAVAFILMLGSGFVMGEDFLSQELKFNLYQWHKSLGVLLLLTLFVRIGWRLFHKPPALPVSIQGLERLAAHAGHIALYACMLAMPITGWLMVSSSVYGLPTIVFGLFEWPHIPDLQGNEGVHSFAKILHFYVAIAFVIFILGHIGAVVKHAIWDKESILPRMMWRRKTMG